MNGLKVNFSTVEDVAELREIDAEFEEMRGRHRKQVALIADKKAKLAELIAVCAASPDDPDKIRQPKRDIVELELVIESERRVLESIDASISGMAKRSSERSGWILSDCRSQVSTNALDELEECKNAIHAQMRRFYLLYFAAHGSYGGAEYELEMLSLDRSLQIGVMETVNTAVGRLHEQAYKEKI